MSEEFDFNLNQVVGEALPHQGLDRMAEQPEQPPEEYTFSFENKGSGWHVTQGRSQKYFQFKGKRALKYLFTHFTPEEILEINPQDLVEFLSYPELLLLACIQLGDEGYLIFSRIWRAALGVSPLPIEEEQEEVEEEEENPVEIYNRTKQERIQRAMRRIQQEQRESARRRSQLQPE
jgi:hypothetical protein